MYAATRFCGLLAIALVLGTSAALPAPGASTGGPAAGRSLEANGLAALRGQSARVRLLKLRGGRVIARVMSTNRRRGTFSAFRRAPDGSAGEVWRSIAEVRGGRVCLVIREVAGGRIVGSAYRCGAARRGWRQVGAAYRTRRDGSLLLVSVSKRSVRARDSFSLSSLRLARGECRDSCPPVSGPPSPDAPASSEPTPEAAPDDRARPAVGTQFHCTWSMYSHEERVAVLDKLRAAGVRWVRIDVAWDGIEGDHKGARNLWYVGLVDSCVDEARKRGFNVLVTLWLTPGWANGNLGLRAPPANPQDYADIAGWSAQHWRDRVAAWEIWNEPDHDSFWAGTTAQYASLVRAAYPGFKAGDPGARVVLGGPSSNDDAWLAQLYDLGVGGSFDVVATHPYQGFGDAPPEHQDSGHRWWFTHVPAVRAVMVANGDAAKPIWFTEFGWSAHANWSGIPNWQRGVSAQEQADYLVRAVRHVSRNYPYVELMSWYKERAMPGGTDVHQEGYALLGPDLAPRPAYDALRGYLAS